MLKWAGHVARMEEGRCAFKKLTDTPTGKRPLGRPRRRWEDNIRIDLKEIDINARNYVDSVEGRDYWRARMEEGRSAFNILKCTPSEKRHLGRPRGRWNGS